MKRGLVTRRIAAAILISFAGLFLAALAPLFYGVHVDGDPRQASSVLAYHGDIVAIDRPIQFGMSHNVWLLGGNLFATRSASGSSRTIVLSAPVFEITLGNGLPGARLDGAAQAQILAPLLEQLSTFDFDKATVRKGTAIFKWGHGSSATVNDIDADIGLRGGAARATTGQFTYLGQQVTFEILAGSSQTIAINEAAPAASASHNARWPVQMTFKSLPLDMRLDGDLEIADAWSLKAQTDALTSDATRLAAWLGFDWPRSDVGPAVRIRGPARWADGAISFGKSQVFLGDQEGVGAVSLSLREQRPLIEASLAFAALDVAPLLKRTSKSAAAMITDAFSSVSAWPAITTSFPALARFDADLRLSADRLQWQSAPVGKAAATISARNGTLHADFAELDLGAHKGNLQVMINQAVLGATPSETALRGRFESLDVAPLAEQLFGSALVHGHGAGQFEVSGRGATLGHVLKSASGRGSIEARGGGVMPIDLVALQKIAQQLPAIADLSRNVPGTSELTTGWGAAANQSRFDAGAAKFQIRDGAIFIDSGTVVSAGIAAELEGRVGVAASDLDLRIHLTPAARPQVHQPLPRTQPNGTRAQPRRAGDAIAIIGPWNDPSLKRLDSGPLP